MATERINIRLTNDTIGAVNNANVGFLMKGTGTVQEKVAAALLYLASVSPQLFAANTRMVSAQSRSVGAAGGVDIPWPTAEFDALQAALIADPLINNITTTSFADYGQAMGGGGLTPLGTSACFAERSGLLGRKGRGRHFLPYISNAVLTASGLVNATAIGNVNDTYREAFIYNTGQARIDVSVGPTSGVGAFSVLTYELRPQLSNLRSRRR